MLTLIRLCRAINPRSGDDALHGDRVGQRGELRGVDVGTDERGAEDLNHSIRDESRVGGAAAAAAR